MKISRLIAAAGLAVAAAVPAVQVNASEVQDQYFDQLAECLQLLFTDPAQQAEVCGDGERSPGVTGRGNHVFPEPPKEDDCQPIPAFSILAEPDCEPEVIG